MDNQKKDTTETQAQNVPVLTRKIDGMTYQVGVHFSKTSRENMQEKVKRMIMNESTGA